MRIYFFKQATTARKVRVAIQASDAPSSALAERFGTTVQRVQKRKHRDGLYDLSHTQHRLQNTLAEAQETVVVALRQTRLVSLDDLLAVVREFLNPKVTGSGLDRCLRRNGVVHLRNLKVNAPKPKHKPFEPGELN